MAKKTSRCECTISQFFGYIILYAVGAWTFVEGFIRQIAEAGMSSVVIWYIVAFFLIGAARLLKRQCHSSCKLHYK